MADLTSLSNSQLLALLSKKEQSLSEKEQSHQTQIDQLRQQDIALQLNEQTILELTQERDEYKLAYDRLMQQRFRNRSERYIGNPDQLRIDFGDTDEAADAALGLADAVEDAE
jgi:hypothetical protein